MSDLTEEQRDFLKLTRRYKEVNREIDRKVHERSKNIEGRAPRPKDLQKESDALHREIMSRFYGGGYLRDELSEVCDGATPDWSLLDESDEQMELI